MIKLVCTDIDGTLVPDGTDQINSELFDIILELKKKGIMFVAASGRQYESMRKLFEPVWNDMIFIAEGGNLVMCRGEVMDISRIERDIVEELLDDIEAIPECDAMLCTPEASLVNKRSKELIDWLVNGYHFNVEVYDDLREVLDREIIKMSLFQKDGKADEYSNLGLKPKWGDGKRIDMVCAGIQWMDCIPKGSNKGTAIASIQRIMKIDKEETMVFGDNINDIDMIKRAKYSFAVENARDEVKEAAGYIAKSYKQNGVIEVLKNLLRDNLPAEK